MTKSILEFPDNDSELYEMLNVHFYKNYDTDYFINKALLLAALISKPTELIEGGSIDIKWLNKFVRQEIVINNYHSVESLFRLVIAHSEYPDCPWLGILEQNNSNAFKKTIKKIINKEYFIDGHREALETLFFGKRELFKDVSDEDWKENIENLEEIFSHLALNLSETADYNVFKHGASLFSTEMGVEINEALKIDKQEAFMFLGYKRNLLENHIEFQQFRVIKFMKWEEKVAETLIISRLITNLMEVARLKLQLSNELKLNIFKGYKLSDIIGEGIIYSDMKISLRTLRYDRPKKRAKDT